MARSLLAALLLASLASSARADDCALSAAALAEPRADACVSCHRRGSGSGHPVDLDYAGAQARHGGGMRAEHEVVARGVLLEDGKVTCLTCHAARSPWRHHLALPPGAKVSPAVNPRDAATYDPALRAAAGAQLARAAATGERPAVSPKPLCLACHALD